MITSFVAIELVLELSDAPSYIELELRPWHIYMYIYFQMGKCTHIHLLALIFINDKGNAST